VFSGVSIAKEIDGVGDKGSGQTRIVDVQQTLFGAIMNMSLRSACFADEISFMGKKQNYGLGSTLKCWIIRSSKLWDVRLKEFCCILIS
jgi:hypothetical protein